MTLAVAGGPLMPRSELRLACRCGDHSQQIGDELQQFHGDGRADWTFVVELVVPPNPPSTPTDQEIISKLYPDAGKGPTGENVLNGIAWDADKKRLFVTGKLWPKLFAVEVVAK